MYTSSGLWNQIIIKLWLQYSIKKKFLKVKKIIMANTNYYSKFTLWAISLCIYCIIKKTIQNILDFSDDDDGICMYGEEQFNNNFFPSSLSHINKSFSKKKEII